MRTFLLAITAILLAACQTPEQRAQEVYAQLEAQCQHNIGYPDLWNQCMQIAATYYLAEEQRRQNAAMAMLGYGMYMQQYAVPQPYPGPGYGSAGTTMNCGSYPSGTGYAYYCN